MGAIYFLFGVLLWLLVCVSHERAEIQDIICQDDWNFDGDNSCENNTEEIEPNNTTSKVIVPTKRPKRDHHNGKPFCPPLPINRLQNGQIRMLSNERVKFMCDDGYSLIGPSIIRCYKEKWSSNAIPTCAILHFSCDPPEEIPHGIIEGDQWTEGSRIRYRCDRGYSLIGNRERTCENGYWTLLPPVCQDDSEPLKYLADDLKNQFIDKVGNYSSDSSDSRARSIGNDIKFTGLDLFLLIDTSSSIDPVDFKVGIRFTKYLVNEFGASNGVDGKEGTGTRICVITFADTVDVAIKLDDPNIRNKMDAMNRLDAIEPKGGATAIYAALMTVIGTIPLVRDKAKKAIFLLTDGHNNVGNNPPRKAATDLKAFGIEIFAVGIGGDINRNELKSIASEPSRNHMFLLNKFSDLSDIIRLIRENPNEEPRFGPEKCGFLPKVKGKVNEAVSNWPWLATIYVLFPPRKRPSLGICSGSLICRKWVLTSAGCFYGESDRSKTKSKYRYEAYVTLGEFDLSGVDATEKNFRVSYIVFHPEFEPWTESDNDIALVKLSKPAPLEFTYRPVCLPTMDQLQSFLSRDDPSGNMAGWGTVPSSSFLDGNFASDFTILPQVAEVTFIEDLFCKKIIPRNTVDMFCAGSRIKGICSGNLGSPMVMKDGNFHYVIGVLSNKTFCQSHFNMFTDVSRHTRWIRSVTNGCQDHH